MDASLSSPQRNAVEFLIDAEKYFSRLREDLQTAEETIYISGWDIDSRIKLDPIHFPQETLYHLFKNILSKKPKLNIYILCWNYHWFFSFERELWPWLKPQSWGQRVHFIYDSYHPPGGAKHEKFVLIDRKLAFVGGIDLCEGRWDQSSHLPHNAYRRFATGKPTNPFHDIHARITGPCTAFLATYFTERWNRKSRFPQLPLPEVPTAYENFRWLLTQPAWKLQPRVRSNLRWTLYLIRTAEKYIYIENQYLTSRIVIKALAARLLEVDGPEIICVLPENPFGFIDALSMGVLRKRSLRALVDADIHQRLRLCHPVLDVPGRKSIYVHTKLMITDDKWVKLGSCNLNNRSLSLDQELDFLYETSEAKTLLSELLAEHLSHSPQDIEEMLNSKSLCEIIDQHQNQLRTLKRFNVPTESFWEQFFDHDPFFDSYRYFTFYRLFSRLAIGTRNLLARKPTPIRTFLKGLKRPKPRFPWKRKSN